MINCWPLVLGSPRSAIRNLLEDWIGIAGPDVMPVDGAPSA